MNVDLKRTVYSMLETEIALLISYPGENNFAGPVQRMHCFS